MSSFIDMSGTRFGSLVAVSPTGTGGHGKYVKWECLCDCGNAKVVGGNNLRSGNTKSCGCARKNVESKINNVLGKRFGKLTVIDRTDKRSDNGCVLWICRCDCGKVVESISSILKSGIKRSCGCLISETATKPSSMG